MLSEKKNIILSAAIDVFAREGFYSTNTSSIADEADVAVGTIYNYFDSKEAILEEIFARELEQRFKVLKEVRENDDLSTLEKLKKFLQIHFERVRENPNLGQVLVREREFPRKKSEAIRGYFYKIPRKIEEMLSEAHDKGELNVEDPGMAASIIFGSIQGIMENALRNEELSSLDNAPEALTSLLEEGIMKQKFISS